MWPSSDEIIGFLLVAMPYVLAAAVVLYVRWLWGLLKAPMPTVNYYLRRRERGTLVQSDSRPYLGLDGGRGPTGGRLLLARADWSSNTRTALFCWLVMLVCLCISGWLFMERRMDWMLVVCFVGLFFAILALISAPHLVTHQLNRVEVSPCPPAVGDAILLRIHNSGVGPAPPLRVRLRLIEQVQGTAKVGDSWSHEVLWEEPYTESELPVRIPTLYQRTVRIPEHLPGTFLAPGYRLEWIIEVTPDVAESNPRQYPLPVVQ